jgi:hypothetical protein
MRKPIKSIWVTCIVHAKTESTRSAKYDPVQLLESQVNRFGINNTLEVTILWIYMDCDDTHAYWSATPWFAPLDIVQQLSMTNQTGFNTAVGVIARAFRKHHSKSCGIWSLIWVLMIHIMSDFLREMIAFLVRQLQLISRDIDSESLPVKHFIH